MSSARDNYVCWVRYKGENDWRTLVTCDSDAKGAFKVYRESTITELESDLARERASAAALLEKAAKHYITNWNIQSLTCSCGLDLPTGSILASEAWKQHILSLITTDQASARGGASRNDPEPASGNPPATKEGART
jgi:hypothetical protein